MANPQATQTKNPFGLKRILLAFGYTLDGLKHAVGHEPAFQQELILLVALAILAIIAPFSLEITLAIVISHLFILVIELINSAIEAVVDKASPEYNPLAKQAKDMGSAAVFLAFTMAAILWGYALYQVIA